MSRPNRIKYYMKMAELVATRSTCGRASVGAVILYNKRVVATGYNGAAPGSPHCLDHGCLEFEGHCIRTVHAEMNAMLHLDGRYPSLEVYCTHSPCINCLKAMLMVNIKRVYFRKSYKDEGQVALLLHEMNKGDIIQLIEVDNDYKIAKRN